MSLPWKKNYTVTGGLGFIGSHLVDRLLAEGHAVKVVDNFDETLYPKKVKFDRLDRFRREGHARFAFIEADLSEPGSMDRVHAGQQLPETVIHLAAIAGVRPSLKNPVRYAQVNVAGTTNVLDWCTRARVRRVLYASSSSVYGSLAPPFSEDDRLTAILSPYALSKRQGELACDYYTREYQLHTVSLRFFTVYGPRQRPDMFIRNAIQRVMENKEITLYGDGNSFRDYTHVDDIVDGLVALLGQGICPSRFETFNLGCGETTYLNDLVELIEDAVGKRARVRHIDDQKGDVPGTLADISRAKRVLGYKPKVPVSEGIPQMVAWMRDHQ